MIYPYHIRMILNNLFNSIKVRLLVVFFAVFGFFSAHAQLTPFYSDAKGKYGYKDQEGKIIVTPKYDLAYQFVEGMAAFRVDGKYGYINERGNEIVEPRYDFTWHFIGGYATVKKGELYGFIDKSGRELVPPKYEDANNFHGACCYKGMAHVKENGKWKIIKL